MKEYSLIVIGSGSVTNIIDSMIDRDSDLKIALIDKDEPGGICLTRGMHIHPALSEVVERAFQSLASPAHYHHVPEEKARD